MDFIKFPQKAQEEWKLLDRDEKTSDQDIKAWYKKWLTVFQEEVINNEEPGNLLDTLVLQYREAKKRKIAMYESIKKEILTEHKVKQE